MKFTSKTVSIISFNAMGAFNFDSLHGFNISRNIKPRQIKIAQILKKEDPDIIALQEIHTYYVLNLLQKTLNYPHVAYKKFIYGPRGGLVVLSKYPIEKTKYINFKKRGSFFNSSFIARIIRNGMLVCKIPELALTVIDTHATPNLDHDHSINNRFIKYIEAQLEQIAGVVKKLNNKKEHIIVAGDLNVAKNSHSYKRFVSSTKLLDVFSKDSSPTQHQEYLPKGKVVKRIDYIFISNYDTKSKVISKTQLFDEKFLLENGKSSYLSDHIGLNSKILL